MTPEAGRGGSKNGGWEHLPTSSHPPAQRLPLAGGWRVTPGAPTRTGAEQLPWAIHLMLWAKSKKQLVQLPRVWSWLLH